MDFPSSHRLPLGFLRITYKSGMIDTHVLERGIVEVHLEGEDNAGNCEVESCVGHAVEVISELA